MLKSTFAIPGLPISGFEIQMHVFMFCFLVVDLGIMVSVFQNSDFWFANPGSRYLDSYLRSPSVWPQGRWSHELVCGMLVRARVV